MARMVIELTNRCNLACQHCFAERHAATGDLPVEIIETVLREGKGCGIDHLAFTGGEPTLHHQFAQILQRVAATGYTFSFVSNGTTLPRLYPLLLQHRHWFRGVTFSLDGAREETHDRLRGRGSYRRVLQAASVCVMKDLPFTFNMVLTAWNQHEVEELVTLAARLGGRGVRFGYLMPTPETTLRGLDLAPRERRRVETAIQQLQPHALAPVSLAPGYFSTSPFFPCGPLTLQEYNLDYRGNLTLCCQVSGYADAPSDTDLMGNLAEVSLTEACERFHQRVASYLADKRDKISRGEFGGLDYFPCWYCVRYLDKISGLARFPHHPWMQESQRPVTETIHGDTGS